jgi:hypothetical protein
MMRLPVSHRGSLKPPTFVVVALAACLLALAAAVASAKAADGVIVSVTSCSRGDGTTTVPSDAPITIQGIGFAQGTAGLIQSFLIKEHTTLTVSDNTTAVHDLSGEWSEPLMTNGFWLTTLPDTDLGITLAPGESVLVTYDITFNQPLLVAFPPVGPSGDNGPFLTREDGPLSCLITGAT